MPRDRPRRQPVVRGRVGVVCILRRLGLELERRAVSTEARPKKAKRKAVPEVPRRLVNHHKVSEWFGVSARNWRRWYNDGVVPIPHQEIGKLLLYDIEVINHRLRTGQWPEGVEFRPRREPPASRTAPSADAIPTV